MKFVDDNFKRIFIKRKMVKLTVELETVKTARYQKEKHFYLIFLIGLWSIGLLVVMLVPYLASFWVFTGIFESVYCSSARESFC